MRIKPCDWAKLHNVSPQRTYALINNGRFRSACLEADGWTMDADDTPTPYHRQPVDLSGQRYGRLVIKSATTQRVYTSVVWLARCDCGRVYLARSNSIFSRFLSCGCLSRRGGQPYAKCPACGDRFPITMDGGQTPQFCPACAPNYDGCWNICPICGKLFQAPNDTITCSADCASAWEDRVHTSPPSNPPKPAPKSGQPGRRSKVWVLIDPTGQEHIVRNLRQWSEDNVALFFEQPDSGSAHELEYGFRAISAKLRSGSRLKQPTYKGWTLKGPPAYSPD